jgi:hypothetical protein
MKNTEQFIHEALKGLPVRRAPASLETRVLGELSRRAAHPWWRKSFAHWPAAVRATFLVLSAVAAAVLVSGFAYLAGSSGISSAADGFVHGFGRLSLGIEIVQAGANRLSQAVGSLPSFWFYGTLAVLVASYTLLMSAGVVAYRSLVQGRRFS